MNMNRKATQRESQPVGARLSRRFNARTILDLPTLQPWRRLNRPEGRATLANHARTRPG
jgi:hypothetical protein